jgi:hypothetical protein
MFTRICHWTLNQLNSFHTPVNSLLFTNFTLSTLFSSACNFTVYIGLDKGAVVALSVLSIVSDYTLDYWATGVRSPAEARVFPLASVSRLALRHTLPPNQWVTWILAPAVKRGRGATIATHPHLVPRSRMNYTTSPLVAYMAEAGQLYFIGFSKSNGRNIVLYCLMFISLDRIF